MQPSKSIRASFLLFIFPPSSRICLLKVHSELLGHAETEAPADRIEHRTVGVSNVPSRTEPQVHARPHTDVGRGSGKQRISAAPLLSRAGNAVILKVQPGKVWTNEPLPRNVLR